MSCIVTEAAVMERMKVAIGGEGSMAVKAVMGAILARCGDGLILRALCTKGRRLGHSSGRISS